MKRSTRFLSRILAAVLIQLAKDMRAARERGEEQGLNPEEVAFYDALAENNSARDDGG
jgi:type I site-specific restriction-modification system R (restriction) subunit